MLEKPPIPKRHLPLSPRLRRERVEWGWKLSQILYMCFILGHLLELWWVQSGQSHQDFSFILKHNLPEFIQILIVYEIITLVFLSQKIRFFSYALMSFEIITTHALLPVALFIIPFHTFFKNVYLTSAFSLLCLLHLIFIGPRLKGYYRHKVTIWYIVIPAIPLVTSLLYPSFLGTALPGFVFVVAAIPLGIPAYVYIWYCFWRHRVPTITDITNIWIYLSFIWLLLLILTASLFLTEAYFPILAPTFCSLVCLASLWNKIVKKYFDPPHRLPKFPLYDKEIPPYYTPPWLLRSNKYGAEEFEEYGEARARAQAKAKAEEEKRKRLDKQKPKPKHRRRARIKRTEKRQQNPQIIWQKYFGRFLDDDDNDNSDNRWWWWRRPRIITDEEDSHDEDDSGNGGWAITMTEEDSEDNRDGEDDDSNGGRGRR